MLPGPAEMQRVLHPGHTGHVEISQGVSSEVNSSKENQALLGGRNLRKELVGDERMVGRNALRRRSGGISHHPGEFYSFLPRGLSSCAIKIPSSCFRETALSDEIERDDLYSRSRPPVATCTFRGS